MIRKLSRAGFTAATSSRFATTIAIRREDVDWERRVPFTPAQVEEIIKKHGVEVLVQPSKQRCFNIEDYEAVGAKQSEDISNAELIVGVKQVPIPHLIPQKTYLFFSHTIKAQRDNMPMLDAILDRQIRLLDYEKIQQDGNGQRLVAFGKWAGVAGTIDILHALGIRLQALRVDSPFFKIGRAHNYQSVEQCYEILRTQVKPQLRAFAEKRQRPFTFVCTGNGQVSKGAQDVLNQLGIEWVEPSKLQEVKEHGDKTKIYGAVVELKDHLYHKDKEGRVNQADFFEHPENYRSHFATDIAPYMNVLINGIVWLPGQPRLLTNACMKDLQHLYVVADITADPDGSLEFMQECTSLDNPYRFFNRETHEVSEGFRGVGFNYSSVDNLPTQVAPEASEYFGSKLMPLMSEIIKVADNDKKFDELIGEIEPEVTQACITSDGSLTPRFQYIEALREASEQGRKKALVLGAGMVAGPLVKYLDEHGISQTLAGRTFDEANDLAQRAGAKHVHSIQLDIENEIDRLHELVAQHDIVISLVPYTLHQHVAKCAIAAKKNMMTASYLSPVLQDLENDFIDAGIFCLNELGLDPGIDHLLAMECFDKIKEDNGTIKSFISYCGGLPAPEASDNPLGYKFSWSPRGVLMAAVNPAIWMEDGGVKKIREGGAILRKKNRTSDTGFYRGFALESIKNRNSLTYQEPYELDDCHTLIRGTLRFKGYCELVFGLKTVGLLSADKKMLASDQTWNDVLKRLNWKSALSDDVWDSDEDINPNKIQQELHDLGMFDGRPLSDAVKACDNVLDAFAQYLAEELPYQPGERDLVILRHEIIGEDLDTGEQKQHNIDFCHYGEEYGWSAMSKTVALPLAIGTKMALDGEFDGHSGMLRPLEKDIYAPILAELRRLGLHSRTSVTKPRVKLDPFEIM